MQKTWVIFVAALLTSSMSAAAWAQVYTWTDSSGTVHYSDAPPPDGVKYSQLHLTQSTATGSSHVSTTHAASITPKSGSQQSTSGTKKVADTPDNRKSLCKRLTSNMALLQSNQALNAPDANGKLHAMSKQDRKKQLDRAQAEYRQYCTH